jgi:hypothetical protein
MFSIRTLGALVVFAVFGTAVAARANEQLAPADSTTKLKFAPAVLTSDSTDATITPVQYRRWGYGYPYRSYRAYRPYYGGYYARPYYRSYYRPYYSGYYSSPYYSGYYRPYYGGYYGGYRPYVTGYRGFSYSSPGFYGSFYW